ncbi:MAG: hypothetical protein FJX74_12685 [Armatimonadetes bacterium]|nr:hypothetical protein [Armatimonadota bacterium]
MATELAAVLADYDLGEVADLAALRGAHAGGPHVLTTVIGRFLVKALTPAAATPRAVAFRHALAAHLIAQGVHVPRFVRTRSGEPVARVGAATWELQEFIDGRPLRGAESGDAALAGETLAALHQAGADFAPPGLSGGFDSLSIECELDGLRSMERQVRTYLPAPEVIEQMFYVKHCLEASARLLAEADLPAGVIHGNLRRESLILDGAGAVWVTGFDACGRGPLLLDVAALAEAFGGEAVAAYKRQRPLTQAEKDLGSTAAQLVLIRRGLEEGVGIDAIARRLAAVTDL